jgi:hypothetical protein
MVEWIEKTSVKCLINQHGEDLRDLAESDFYDNLILNCVLDL